MSGQLAVGNLQLAVGSFSIIKFSNQPLALKNPKLSTPMDKPKSFAYFWVKHRSYEILQPVHRLLYVLHLG